MKKIQHPYQISSSDKRDDIRILPFVKNGVEYNYCFVLLNPFYKRKQRFNNFKKEKPNWIEGSKSEILNDYDKYYWTDFINQSGISDIKEIFHCLYVSDHNYIERFQKVKKQVWEAFKRIINENQLISSSDSHISILLINEILAALIKMGYDSLALYDIFDENFEFTKTSKLIESEIEFPSEFRLLTNDRKLLFYQEYEHYETFIYSTDLKLLEYFLELTEVEGFFANHRTTLLWSEIEYEENDKILSIKED